MTDSSDYLFLLGNNLFCEHRGFHFEEVVKVGDVFCVRFRDKLRHITIDVLYKGVSSGQHFCL